MCCVGRRQFDTRTQRRVSLARSFARTTPRFQCLTEVQKNETTQQNSMYIVLDAAHTMHNVLLVATLCDSNIKQRRQ